MKKQDYNYIYKTLIPAIENNDKRFSQNENGCLVYNGSDIQIDGKFCIPMMTPFWEDSDGIQVDVMFDNGEYKSITILPFQLKGDIVQDVVEYIKTVDKWLKKHSK